MILHVKFGIFICVIIVFLYLGNHYEITFSNVNKIVILNTTSSSLTIPTLHPTPTPSLNFNWPNLLPYSPYNYYLKYYTPPNSTSPFACYNPMAFGIGHQIIAMSALYSYFGNNATMFRILDPIESQHSEMHGENYGSFINNKIVLNRTFGSQCFVLHTGYPDDETRNPPFIGWEMGKPGFNYLFIGRFLLDNFNYTELCVKRKPKSLSAFAVKIRLSDINGDGRKRRNLTTDDYCRVITRPEYMNSSCVVMGDFTTLPCRPDCEYLDSNVTLQATGYNTKDLMCNLMFVLMHERVVTMKESNLQSVMDGMLYAFWRGKRVPWMYDVWDHREYKLSDVMPALPWGWKLPNS